MTNRYQRIVLDAFKKNGGEVKSGLISALKEKVFEKIADRKPQVLSQCFNFKKEEAEEESEEEDLTEGYIPFGNTSVKQFISKDTANTLINFDKDLAKKVAGTNGQAIKKALLTILKKKAPGRSPNEIQKFVDSLGSRELFDLAKLIRDKAF